MRKLNKKLKDQNEQLLQTIKQNERQSSNTKRSPTKAITNDNEKDKKYTELEA